MKMILTKGCLSALLLLFCFAPKAFTQETNKSEKPHPSLDQKVEKRLEQAKKDVNQEICDSGEEQCKVTPHRTTRSKARTKALGGGPAAHAIDHQDQTPLNQPHHDQIHEDAKPTDPD